MAYTNQVRYRKRSSFGRKALIFWLVVLLVSGCACGVALGICKGQFLDNCFDPWAHKQLISQVDPNEYNVIVDANLPYSGVVGDIENVLGLIPTGDKSRVGAFIDGMNFFADRYDALHTLIQCGYDTGSITTVIYQNNQRPWSVGFQLIVNGSLVNAFVESGVCFIGRRLAQGKVPIAFALEEPTKDPGYAVCDLQPRSLLGRHYTVLTFTSTFTTCSDLTGLPTPPSPGGSPSGQQLAGTATGTTFGADVYVRSNPAVNYADQIVRLMAGVSGTVACYRDGDQATNEQTGDSNNHWDLTRFPTGVYDEITKRPTGGPVTGFVADVFLDTRGDITGRVRRCSASDGTSEPVTLDVSNVTVGPPAVQCDFNPWRFSANITANYAADLRITWFIGSVQKPDTLTFTGPGTRSVSTTETPVQNGTTNVRIVVADDNRGPGANVTTAAPSFSLTCQPPPR